MSGAPKFKFSLAAYSYRTLLTGKEPKLTIFDFVDDCAKFQLEATELTSYYFPTTVTPEYVRKLKAHCFRLGLDISGTAIGNDFGHPDGEIRQQQIDSTKKWIEHAEILGAPVIRIFAGHQQKGSTGGGSQADGVGNGRVLRIRRTARRLSGFGKSWRSYGDRGRIDEAGQ